MTIEGQNNPFEVKILQEDLYVPVLKDMQRALMYEKAPPDDEDGYQSLAKIENPVSETDPEFQLNLNNKDKHFVKWIRLNSETFRIAFNSLFDQSRTMVYEWQNEDQRQELIDKIKNRMRDVRANPQNYVEYKDYDYRNPKQALAA